MVFEKKEFLSYRTSGEISISDIHIDESVILDVMAAAAFFDCSSCSFISRSFCSCSFVFSIIGCLLIILFSLTLIFETNYEDDRNKCFII